MHGPAGRAARAPRHQLYQTNRGKKTGGACQKPSRRRGGASTPPQPPLDAAGQGPAEERPPAVLRPALEGLRAGGHAITAPTDTIMQDALQNGADWLDSADNHKKVCMEVVDGVSSLLFFLDKESPGQVRFGSKGARKIVPIAEFMSEVIPSLSLEIERIEIQKWISIESSKYNMQRSFVELVFQTAPNERQQKDHNDLAKYENLSSKLYKKIFPVWRIVANGTRSTTWTSGQSTDCLVFFCAWLICIEPSGNKAQFFLDASEQDITQELDTNYLEYTYPITDPQITEYYLKGDDPPDARALACFRERWPSLTMASSGDP